MPGAGLRLPLESREALRTDGFSSHAFPLGLSLLVGGGAPSVKQTHKGAGERQPEGCSQWGCLGGARAEKSEGKDFRHQFSLVLQAGGQGARSADLLTPQNHLLYPKPCLPREEA